MIDKDRRRFGAKRQKWKIQPTLTRLSSGPIAPCPRRSGGCQISPAFKWLTNLQRTYWRTYRPEINGPRPARHLKRHRPRHGEWVHGKEAFFTSSSVYAA